MAGEGSNVGSIFGRLGFHFDSSGSREFDAVRRRLKGETEKPIEQRLGATVDDSEINRYNRQLEEIRQRNKRREDFKARLGADYDPRAFNAYERDLRRAQRGEDDMVRSSAKLHTAFGNIYGRGGALFAAAGGLYGLVNAFKSVTGAYQESQVSQVKLQTQLKASGIAYRDHATEIDRVIQKTSQLAGLDDEDLQDAFTNIVRVTGDVSKSLRLTGLAADFARAKHMDVAKAGELVGKVAGGNLGILSRYGIVLQKGATATEALGVLQQKFGGQAAAYGRTQAGSLDRVQVAWENLRETIGQKLAPTITKAANGLANFINEMQDGTGEGGKFVDVLDRIWNGLSATASFIKDHAKLIGLAATAWAGYRTAALAAAAAARAAALVGIGSAGAGVAAGGAGGAALGPAGLAIGAGAALAIHGLSNKVQRSLRADAAADTFAGRFAGADPAQIDRINKAMDVQQSKVLLSSKQWDRYRRVLEQAGISSGASRQDLDAINARFDKLRGPITRAGDALRKLFGPNTRIGASDLLDPNAVDQLRSDFEHMRKYGADSIGDLRDRLQFNLREISKGFREGTAGWRAAMIDNFGAGIAAVKKGMRDGSISVKDGMTEIRKITRQQMGFTRDNMRDLSADGKQALAQNFEQAVGAIKKQMRAGTVTTKDGMAAIRGYLTQELRLYGFSISQARNIAATGDPDANRGREGGAFRQRGGLVKRARGGWIGGKGMVGDDTVQVGPDALAAPGEFHAAGSRHDAIINRHQAPLANLFMLASGGPFQSLDDLASRGRGVDQVGYLDSVMGPIGGLAGLFSSIQRPHMMQEGGLFDRARKFAYGGVTGPLASLITRLDRMGFAHGSTTGGGHAPNSYHYKGEAVDYGNATNNLSRLWSVVFPMRARFAELFGPPGLFHFGSRFADPALQAQHNDHIHMALTGALGRALGAPKQIRAPRIRAGGGVGQAVQAALGLAAGAANRVVSRATAIGPFDSAEAAAGNLAGGSNLAIGQRMAAARGWTGGLWTALRSLWTRESGWRTTATNPTSGAYGIPQALPASKMASAGADYRTNPATQIRWGLGYIADRYGNPARALAHENAYNWYRGGGFMRRFASGGLTSSSAASGAASRAAGAFKQAQGFELKALKRRISHRVSDYDALMGDHGAVELDRSRYDIQEREYNRVDDGDLVDEHGNLNQGLYRQKILHLYAMGMLARRIADNIAKAKAIAKRTLAAYRRVVTTLSASLRHAGRKDRGGIRRRLKDARSAVTEWSGTFSDLGFDVQNARLDWQDLGGELKDLNGGISSAQADARASAAGDTTTVDSGGGGITADQQAQLDQVDRLKAIVTQGNFLNAAGLRSLSVFDSNRVGTAGYAGAGGQANPYVPPGGQPGGGGGFTLADGTQVPAGANVTVLQIQTLHPADPQTLQLIAKASNAGNSYLGYVQSSRASTGV